MPRNVRNFWIDLSVDGRSSRIEAGPAGKDGGFQMDILMRDSGGIAQVLTVRGQANNIGELTLQVYVPRDAENESLRVRQDVDPGDILIKTRR